MEDRSSIVKATVWAWIVFVVPALIIIVLMIAFILDPDPLSPGDVLAAEIVLAILLFLLFFTSRYIIKKAEINVLNRRIRSLERELMKRSME